MSKWPFFISLAHDLPSLFMSHAESFARVEANVALRTRMLGNEGHYKIGVSISPALRFLTKEAHGQKRRMAMTISDTAVYQSFLQAPSRGVRNWRCV